MTKGSGWQKKPEGDGAISKFNQGNQMFYPWRHGVQVENCLPPPNIQTHAYERILGNCACDNNLQDREIQNFPKLIGN